MTVREFDRVVLLRELDDAGFRRRTHPAGTTGVVVDLVEGRTHCEVEVFYPPDVLAAALDDLAPRGDARIGGTVTCGRSTPSSARAQCSASRPSGRPSRPIPF